MLGTRARRLNFISIHKTLLLPCIFMRGRHYATNSSLAHSRLKICNHEPRYIKPLSRAPSLQSESTFIVFFERVIWVCSSLKKRARDPGPSAWPGGDACLWKTDLTWPPGEGSRTVSRTNTRRPRRRRRSSSSTVWSRSAWAGPPPEGCQGNRRGRPARAAWNAGANPVPVFCFDVC